MSGLKEALYFPFLRFKSDSIEKISPFFSKIYLLSLPGPSIAPDSRAEFLQPENLDSAFLETISRILDEKISLSGPESLQFLISEKKEPLPSLSTLVDGIVGGELEENGKKENPEKKEAEKEALHLAALLLSRAEELDFLHEELERELAAIDRAEKNMLSELMGEAEKPGDVKKSTPEHLEPRMLAWLKLLGACGKVPAFWITDMFDAERLFEKIFPEGKPGALHPELEGLATLAGKDCTVSFLEIPLNAAKLSGISFSDKTKSLKVLFIA